MENGKRKSCFDKAAEFAKRNCTCIKVPVGSLFVDLSNQEEYYECNRSFDFDCKTQNECYKAKVTGIYESCEETRKYCKAIHSEVNMIELLKKNRVDPKSGILFITRYPCLNCAKKIVEFGFNIIAYCGKQEISDEVKQLFYENKIIVDWYPELDYEF